MDTKVFNDYPENGYTDDGKNIMFTNTINKSNNIRKKQEMIWMEVLNQLANEVNKTENRMYKKMESIYEVVK